MTKVRGIVSSYDPKKKKVVCRDYPHGSYFMGGKVFIGGEKPSFCDTVHHAFQVTVPQSYR